MSTATIGGLNFVPQELALSSYCNGVQYLVVSDHKAERGLKLRTVSAITDHYRLFHMT
jgi:hypothetical protein